MTMKINQSTNLSMTARHVRLTALPVVIMYRLYCWTARIRVCPRRRACVRSSAQLVGRCSTRVHCHAPVCRTTYGRAAQVPLACCDQTANDDASVVVWCGDCDCLPQVWVWVIAVCAPDNQSFSSQYSIAASSSALPIDTRGALTCSSACVRLSCPRWLVPPYGCVCRRHAGQRSANRGVGSRVWHRHTLRVQGGVNVCGREHLAVELRGSTDGTGVPVCTQPTVRARRRRLASLLWLPRVDFGYRRYV